MSTLNEQFQVLNNLKHHGHAGTDKAIKVWRLNAGIKTDKLNAPEAQETMSICALQDLFDDAAGPHQDFIAQSKSNNNKNNKFNVSGFEGVSGGAGGPGGRDAVEEDGARRRKRKRTIWSKRQRRRSQAKAWRH
jgi:hypothetical protein